MTNPITDRMYYLVNGSTWVDKEKIPTKIQGDTFDGIIRYIYLLKIKNPQFFRYTHEKDTYKVGYTSNIKNRMESLRHEKITSVELVAYGYSKNHIKSEKHLLEKFSKHKVSAECLKFYTYDELNAFIKEMKEVCFDVITFEKPRPECTCWCGSSVHTKNEAGEWVEEFIPLDPVKSLEKARLAGLA